MAEKAIRRKSLYLTAFAPIQVSLDKLVIEHLEPGKFLYTKTAWIKIFAMLISCASLGFFLGQSWSSCEDKPTYFLILFPVCISVNILIELLFFLVFVFGLSIKSPGKWIKMDILFNLTFSILSIIAAVITLTANVKCKENSEMHKIPIYFGIFASGLSIIGSAAIFLMYRYVEDNLMDDPVSVSKPKETQDPRKSIFA